MTDDDAADDTGRRDARDVGGEDIVDMDRKQVWGVNISKDLRRRRGRARVGETEDGGVGHERALAVGVGVAFVTRDLAQGGARAWMHWD